VVRLTAATATCVLTAGVTGTTVLAVPNADTLICTTAGAIVAATAITFTFLAGAVTTGMPQGVLTFNVATSTDQQLASPPATLALGSTVDTVTTITVATADQIPNQVNTAAITVIFRSVTAVPTAGKITITLPRGYFAKVDESKANTLTAPATTTATCALVQATGVATQDSIICTTSGVLNAGGTQTLTFAAGTITTGGAVGDKTEVVNIAT